MGIYFQRMERQRQNKALDSRIRFMIQDVLDLRAHRWEPRNKKEGPKKIEVRAWVWVCAWAVARVCVHSVPLPMCLCA